MMSLNGSDKQISWAQNIRDGAITELKNYENLLIELEPILKENPTDKHIKVYKNKIAKFYLAMELVNFIREFYENCSDSSHFIDFRDEFFSMYNQQTNHSYRSDIAGHIHRHFIDNSASYDVRVYEIFELLDKLNAKQQKF